MTNCSSLHRRNDVTRYIIAARYELTVRMASKPFLFPFLEAAAWGLPFAPWHRLSLSIPHAHVRDENEFVVAEATRFDRFAVSFPKLPNFREG